MDLRCSSRVGGPRFSNPDRRIQASALLGSRRCETSSRNQKLRGFLEQGHRMQVTRNSNARRQSLRPAWPRQPASIVRACSRKSATGCSSSSRALSVPRVFVKRGYHREGIAGVVKKTPGPERPSDRGFPPKQTFAEAIGSFLHNTIYFFEKLLLSFRRFWKRSGPLLIFGGHPVVSGLHDKDIFLVLTRHEKHVLAEIIQAAVPPGIVRLPNHVIIHMIGMEFVEKILGPNLVAAAVDVDHDPRMRCISGSRFNTCNARLDQIGEVVPIAGQTAIRPEHAIDDFITDLDHVRKHSRLAECRYRLLGVFENRLDQLDMRHALPGFWKELLAWIGPSIGIVIVEQEMETKFLGGFGERNCVFQIIGKFHGCVKEPQANPVVAMILEYFQSRLGCAVVFENLAAVLCLL